ncbi:class I SAM-dependent methyltransferase [Limnochorda pilosa]|uniref:Methyltransferase type 11 n=1 Tax=Limnochorda pilosa TaxID=1555112 RepID=A0A0K2SJ46_LIMPI|nr:class I SAM-dependent methyltransferase [Limnochorda pilosa]BAS26859.1 methyltransferase type 11 [Limnochorda pilosa]
MRPMNFFRYNSEAARYARFRPYFHPMVVERVRKRLELDEPLEHALDVGCGTGQSAVALKPIARSITGVDSSRSMLEEALSDECVRYVEAPAEDLPFRDESYELVTVSLALHWFERAKFLFEAARVLKNNGWLVIYDNWFSGVMRENPKFLGWVKEVYLHRYPAPPRDSRPIDAEEAGKYGFRLLEDERYENEVAFTVEELAAYLSTQTNVVGAVEAGSEALESVLDWLMDQLRPMFPRASATFVFRGRIWYLQKSGSS